MQNSNSNFGNQTAAAEAVPSKDQPANENHQLDGSHAEDESYSVIEDNYYQRVYPSLDEQLLD